MLEQIQNEGIQALFGLISLVLVPFIIKVLLIIGSTSKSKYVTEIVNMIMDMVLATNQDYVIPLKESGKWSEANHDIAFEKTKTAIMALLTERMRKVIIMLFGDLELWVNNTITAKVLEAKTMGL